MPTEEQVLYVAFGLHNNQIVGPSATTELEQAKTFAGQRARFYGVAVLIAVRDADTIAQYKAEGSGPNARVVKQ